MSLRNANLSGCSCNSSFNVLYMSDTLDLIITLCVRNVWEILFIRI
jgi:hypothetical protein